MCSSCSTLVNCREPLSPVWQLPHHLGGPWIPSAVHIQWCGYKRCSCSNKKGVKAGQNFFCPKTTTDGFCGPCPQCSPLVTGEVWALPGVCSEDLLSCGRSSTIMHVEGRTAASPAPCKGRVTLLGVHTRGYVTNASNVLLSCTCCCEALRAQCAVSACWTGEQIA